MTDIMVWMATAATLNFAVPVRGGQNDPRLTVLFERLRRAGEDEARRVERAIWQIWSRSGDDVIDRLMARGLAALAGEDCGAALAAFGEVVRRLPGFAEGWNRRATVHYLLGDYEKSVADAEKALALEPRHFGALSGLGLIALALGEEKRALDAFEAALAIHPHLPGVDTHIRALRRKVTGRDD